METDTMGHPTLYNRTPFLFEPLFLNDKESNPVLVGVLKASFRIQDQSLGPLIPLAEQIAVNVAGEFNGDAEASSYLYEPEVAPVKPNTDVVLIATARSPQAGAKQFDVGIRVGDTIQRATVFGDRVWLDGAGSPTISAPKPIETLPLIYEHAFGGIDPDMQINGVPALESRNPVGKGFHHPSSGVRLGSALPNIENPSRLISGYHDAPDPVGFGFTGPNWQPRAAYAGTYDEAWEASRKPWLPSDFDTRYHNAASNGLILEKRLNGQEKVRVVNASPTETLEFVLPGLPQPVLHMQSRTGATAKQPCELDTIIINTDEMLLMMLYRGSLPVSTGMHDTAKIGVIMDGFNNNGHLRPLA